MTGIFVMVSNYFHDLAVALLASNILVVWYLGRLMAKEPSRGAVLRYTLRKLSRVTYGALAFVLVGGAVRAWFFMDYEWNPAVGRGQVAALVVKHILLVTLTIVGLTLHARYVRKYARES